MFRNKSLILKCLFWTSHMLKVFLTIRLSFRKLWQDIKVNFYINKRINPTYVDAIFNKGDILIALNRIDEGIEWITKAINL